MLNQSSIQEFQRCIATTGVQKTPTWHIVLGSGFGKALDQLPVGSAWVARGGFSFEKIPGLVASTAPDHQGQYRIYEHKPTGQSVVFQLGRVHGYEGHSARDAVSPVMIGRLAGIQKFLLTNAAGGLPPNYDLGDVMLIRDHVNLTGQNPLMGANPASPAGAVLGPRFPDMSSLYDPEWRKTLRSNLTQVGLRVHEGVYLGLLGPSFETHAEVELFGRWGMQAVGMSTVWEAIALKHSGARLAGLSLVSNAAAGLGDGAPIDHEKILETCRKSAQQIIAGVLRWLEAEV
jgi:purine-nucleoside phosphorylase